MTAAVRTSTVRQPAAPVRAAMAALVDVRACSAPRLRAIAEDLTAARLTGLPVDRLIVLAFAIASGFAGLGGVLWAAQTGVTSPDMGFQPLLKAFVAAIVGGLGSVPAALLGGYLLGALEVAISAALPSALAAYRDAWVFALLIGFLLYRPDGLLNQPREVKL